jgi:hypothetical protein
MDEVEGRGFLGGLLRGLFSGLPSEPLGRCWLYKLLESLASKKGLDSGGGSSRGIVTYWLIDGV